MTIRTTQKKGLSIHSKVAEVILAKDKISIVDNDKRTFVIDTPGEYEVSGIAVFSYRPMPTFLIETDYIVVGYIPSVIEQQYEEQVANELQRVDILLIPGKSHALVSLLAPYIVIPLDDKELLAKALKKDLPEPVKSLNIKSRSELPEETNVVLLEL